MVGQQATPTIGVPRVCNIIVGFKGSPTSVLVRGLDNDLADGNWTGDSAR